MRRTVPEVWYRAKNFRSMRLLHWDI
jgi:hypothetical protein